MENMRAVFVDVDSLDVLAINVSAQVSTLVEDEALFAGASGAVCERRSEKARAYDEVVEFFHSTNIILKNI
jgi:hypothetical protein